LHHEDIHEIVWEHMGENQDMVGLSIVGTSLMGELAPNESVLKRRGSNPVSRDG
jgi:hypothetical protein